MEAAPIWDVNTFLYDKTNGGIIQWGSFFMGFHTLDILALWIPSLWNSEKLELLQTNRHKRGEPVKSIVQQGGGENLLLL